MFSVIVLPQENTYKGGYIYILAPIVYRDVCDEHSLTESENIKIARPTAMHLWIETLIHANTMKCAFISPFDFVYLNALVCSQQRNNLILKLTEIIHATQFGKFQFLRQISTIQSLK